MLKMIANRYKSHLVLQLVNDTLDVLIELFTCTDVGITNVIRVH